MCEGVFVWFPCTQGAILFCSCGHLTVSGNVNRSDHYLTPVIPEG
jgi:hypothetical protein